MFDFFCCSLFFAWMIYCRRDYVKLIDQVQPREQQSPYLAGIRTDVMSCHQPQKPHDRGMSISSQIATEEKENGPIDPKNKVWLANNINHALTSFVQIGRMANVWPARAGPGVLKPGDNQVPRAMRGGRRMSRQRARVHAYTRYPKPCARLVT